MTNKYGLLSVPIPTIIPYTIRGENASEVAKELNLLIDKDFDRNHYLKRSFSLIRSKGVPIVGGSDPYLLPLVRRVTGMRTARPEDIQRTLNDGDSLSLRGNHSVDLGLVLTIREPPIITENSSDLAKHFYAGDLTSQQADQARALNLYSQLPPELRSLDKLPIVILDYEVKNSITSDIGLDLVVTDYTKFRPTPILAQCHNSRNSLFKDEDVSPETGMPTKAEGGERKLYSCGFVGSCSLDNLSLDVLHTSTELGIGMGFGEGGHGDRYTMERIVLFDD